MPMLKYRSLYERYRGLVLGGAFAPGELFSANPFFRSHMRINFGHRLDERRRAELIRLCAIAREVPDAR